MPNDGCTNCLVDTGYTCTAAVPNVCTLLCGNGVMNANEVLFIQSILSLY